MSIHRVVEHVATAVAAVAGALPGRGKSIDLFGVIVLAQVTALGGGTLRDVILDARPVFWVADPSYVLTATLSAVILFVVVRFWRLPGKVLLVADAGALALFTALGVHKSLSLGIAPLVSIAMGVMTGVAGGIIRDVLTREIPLVFRHEVTLYATASFCGATVYATLYGMIDGSTVWVIGIATTLLIRLAAIQWKLKLPLFDAK